MTIKRPKTFWTSLVLFVVGVVITVNIIRFNYPEFRPLALFALATGIGFLAAGYGLWLLKKWGAILAVIISCLKLVQIIVYAGLSVYTPGGIIIYGGIMLLAISDWKRLK
ncbi:MAG TPA: hypothetical protein VMW67_06665 [Desulfobacteria bacterium]|nr:hypothetical protein [Desulfobacteria bacterium]